MKVLGTVRWQVIEKFHRLGEQTGFAVLPMQFAEAINAFLACEASILTFE